MKISSLIMDSIVILAIRASDWSAGVVVTPLSWCKMATKNVATQ